MCVCVCVCGGVSSDTLSPSLPKVEGVGGGGHVPPVSHQMTPMFGAKVSFDEFCDPGCPRGVLL